MRIEWLKFDDYVPARIKKKSLGFVPFWEKVSSKVTTTSKDSSTWKFSTAADDELPKHDEIPKQQTLKQKKEELKKRAEELKLKNKERAWGRGDLIDKKAVETQYARVSSRSNERSKNPFASENYSKKYTEDIGPGWNTSTDVDDRTKLKPRSASMNLNQNQVNQNNVDKKKTSSSVSGNNRSRSQSVNNNIVESEPEKKTTSKTTEEKIQLAERLLETVHNSSLKAGQKELENLAGQLIRVLSRSRSPTQSSRRGRSQQIKNVVESESVSTKTENLKKKRSNSGSHRPKKVRSPLSFKDANAIGATTRTEFLVASRGPSLNPSKAPSPVDSDMNMNALERLGAVSSGRKVEKETENNVADAIYSSSKTSPKGETDKVFLSGGVTGGRSYHTQSRSNSANDCNSPSQLKLNTPIAHSISPVLERFSSQLIRDSTGKGNQASSFVLNNQASGISHSLCVNSSPSQTVGGGNTVMSDSILSNAKLTNAKHHSYPEILSGGRSPNSSKLYGYSPNSTNKAVRSPKQDSSYSSSTSSPYKNFKVRIPDPQLPFPGAALRSGDSRLNPELLQQSIPSAMMNSISPSKFIYKGCIEPESPSWIKIREMERMLYNGNHYHHNTQRSSSSSGSTSHMNMLFYGEKEESQSKSKSVSFSEEKASELRGGGNDEKLVEGQHQQGVYCLGNSALDDPEPSSSSDGSGEGGGTSNLNSSPLSPARSSPRRRSRINSAKDSEDALGKTTGGGYLFAPDERVEEDVIEEQEDETSSLKFTSSENDDNGSPDDYLCNVHFRDAQPTAMPIEQYGIRKPKPKKKISTLAQPGTKATAKSSPSPYSPTKDLTTNFRLQEKRKKDAGKALASDGHGITHQWKLNEQQIAMYTHKTQCFDGPRAAHQNTVFYAYRMAQIR